MKIILILEILLDVILINKFNFFRISGFFSLEISDYYFIYGILK